MPTNQITDKVLIVDDDLSNAELLEGILAKAGYTEYKSLTDSRLVVPTFREWKPDIILLDLMMPHIDGFGVMEALKPLMSPEEFIPIIVLTADASAQTRMRALAAGAVDFITKPFDVMEVTLRIKNFLRTRELYLQLRDYNVTLEKKVRERTKEVYQANKRFRRLTSELHDVVWSSSPDGKQILDINDACEGLYGVPAQQFIANPNLWIEMVHPEDRSIAERSSKELLNNGRAEAEYRIVRPDGTIRWIRDRKSLLKDGQGNPVQMGGIANDITERKSMEEQILRTQRMESIGTLASGIAHDFNNILGIILGHCALLQRNYSDPSKLSQSIESIEKATHRGASLVKQLLTFARKTEPKLTSININDLIREITKLLHETFPKTIDIHTTLDENLPATTADATQIHQVLLNLCVNARDAMPDGGTLTITTTTVAGNTLAKQFPKAAHTRYIRITVTDTGTGIDEATKQRIFEPFFTTKGPEKGTGLGLSVVFGIVQSHQGFIDLSSEVGKGTTFNLYFPIQEQHLQHADSPRIHVENIPGGTETILLIEDEEMLTELVKAMLTSKGYTVLTAADGEEGVSMFRRHQNEIAVVLSDMGLPLLSGYEVCKRIAKLDPKTKIILASGFVEPNVASELYKLGVKRIIQKPYSTEEVLHAVRSVIDATNE